MSMFAFYGLSAHAISPHFGWQFSSTFWDSFSSTFWELFSREASKYRKDRAYPKALEENVSEAYDSVSDAHIDRS